jgi:hypothetical protein
MSWRSVVELRNRHQQVQEAIAALLADVPAEAVSRRPPGARWSMEELLAHLVLTEQRVLDDLGVMLLEEHPELASIDELDDPALLKRVIADAGSLDGLLDLFARACQTTLALMETLDEDQELRSGHSPDLGNVLVGSFAANNARYHYLGHIEDLRQLRRALGLRDVEVASLSPY